MNDSCTRLRDGILAARDIARATDLVTLSEDERRRAVEEAQGLLDKLDAAAQRYLVVGLLGGTGVGKSTLMNALAGSPISSASHRRPHTDAILMYRHGDAPLPFFPDPEVAWREFTHTTEAVRQIILCDLPDYDSLLSDHRRQVLGFMEHVDIVLWLTSPEKYADGSFYEFLKLVPKSQHNFYFAVNKADLFFDGKGTEEGFDELRRVYADFQGHLRKADIPDPVIYTLSASEAFNQEILSSWNQFPGLRQEIFRQRDLKEIQNIRAANLDREYARYLALFETELAHLETMHDILTGTIREIEAGLAEEQTFVQETVHAVMDEGVRAEVRSQIDAIFLLTGPGYGVAELMRHWKYRGQHRNEEAQAASFGIAVQRTSQVFQRRLESITSTIISGIVRGGAHHRMVEQIEEVIRLRQHTGAFQEKLEQQVGSQIASSRRAPHLPFRAGQYAVYLFLIVTLIVALAGKEAWQDLFANRALSPLLNFIFTAFYNLFSPGGLAALGSFALINLFFGVWFYRRYRNLIERKTDEIIDSFVENVGTLWQEVVGHITAALKEYDRTLGITARSLRELKK